MYKWTPSFLLNERYEYDIHLNIIAMQSIKPNI